MTTATQIADQQVESPHNFHCDQDIEFVDDSRFHDAQFVHQALESIVDLDELAKAETLIKGEEYCLPSRPIMSHQLEGTLFLRMNFLRFLAACRTGQPARKNKENCARRDLLNEANAIRDHILKANQRLVVTMASKFQGKGISLADLIGEGNLSLLRAVAKFDTGRGFRFSTYASYAIIRNLGRLVQREQKRRIAGFECEEHVSFEDEQSDWIDIHPGELTNEILSELSERERRVVTDRFGLNNSGQGRTLREVAAGLGLSKERVRQLVVTACEKARAKHGSKLGLFDRPDGFHRK